MFGVERARSTVHNWVYKADLRPKSGRSPDLIAGDGTVILLNDEQYWLYAAVDPETSELLHTKLEPTTTKVLAHSFLTETSEKHDVFDAVFLIDCSHSLQDACQRHGYDFRYEKLGNPNAVERVFREIKRRTICFSNLLVVLRTKQFLDSRLASESFVSNPLSFTACSRLCNEIIYRVTNVGGPDGNEKLYRRYLGGGVDD